jgi:hypothetical protein
MNEINLIEGTYLDNIKCVLVYDKLTYRNRVRPLPNQDLPTSLFIECSKSIREKYPVGTIFIAKSVKVCCKETGVFYLRAEKQIITPLIED